MAIDASISDVSATASLSASGAVCHSDRVREGRLADALVPSLTLRLRIAAKSTWSKPAESEETTRRLTPARSMTSASIYALPSTGVLRL